MKLTTPQIVWHSKEPVFSADFHHSGELWRLATGGADKDIKIWKVVREEGGKVKIVFMSSLSRHSGSVNVVRFSPNGELLASAGDDNVVCLWRLGEGGGASSNIATDTTLVNKETWNVTKMLRGHVEDIYDACWSASSSYLVTGSVDNTAIIWDISKGQSLCTLADSKQYVQGVAWDPIGQYLATLSNDRYLRVYAVEQKFKCVHSVSKMTVPENQEKGGGAGRQFRMWIDESLSFFFRRLTFSPDGNLLVVPAGRYENGEKTTNMTYIFTKSNLAK
ncbi:Chromatin assembly factor 1 subunit B [Geodia barretti]|nr:Chromatin assembly factor 1 subunit B [Geodia barretti]